MKSLLEIEYSELSEQLLGNSEDNLRNTYLRLLGEKLEQWCENLVDAESAVC